MNIALIILYAIVLCIAVRVYSSNKCDCYLDPMNCQFFVVRDSCRKHKGDIKLPRRATSGACAYDFYSPASYTIEPGETKMIWTDVKILLPSFTALLINVRSSMGKPKIHLANTQGWVDADYFSNVSNDGNIGIMLSNDGTTPYVINAGDRIAQGMIVQCLATIDDNNSYDERLGGFGSTGKV